MDNHVSNLHGEGSDQYELAMQFARLEPPPPEMQQLFAAMRGNQKATDRYFATIEGTITPAEISSPQNIGQILEQASWSFS